MPKYVIESDWHYLIATLAEKYDEKGIAVWLRAPKMRWSSKERSFVSAVNLIAEGQMDEVIKAAEEE